ncbi:MAG: GTPase Era, partial [Lachnospiraceae bacterium]|nr:GTPase Era [Lachnospiraceae bacterium]
VGKSTLMNNLIGQKIAITSSKPQTTRNRIQTVYTDEVGQIIFLDTPGIHKAQNKLGEYMDSVAERTLSEVDVVLWLVEPTTFIGKGEHHIAKLLETTKTPVILVVNKIDTVEKGELLPVIDKYKDIVDFKACIPVSAVTGENKEDLLKTVFDLLPEGPMYYDEDVVTDQAERQITAELIREQTLRRLKDEVPHGVAVMIESMKEEKDTSVRHSHKNIMNIEATIFCERDSHKGIIIGKKGAMLKEIGTNARHQISDLLGMKVNLNLWVKVKKDWRNSDSLMKNFGYKEE